MYEQILFEIFQAQETEKWEHIQIIRAIIALHSISHDDDTKLLDTANLILMIDQVLATMDVEDSLVHIAFILPKLRQTTHSNGKQLTQK